ncbi:DNA polymerase beta superfamily protein [Nordella sp. HKS 07]|uniref:nucleotidyltransferase domain-containing protein n=1 Tax=Nordella sp. HKS 07 TaxID=2712222 RepID=UPI001FEE6236|nr:nucleotidyltransferase domain-containing protein [Nordella sp. HKS 07]
MSGAQMANGERLRTVDAGMDETVVARIDARLADIARDHQVTIPLAIESGSRAWGFPSPDSDYDCRFVFVRPIQHYLSLWQRRDVIETEMDGVLDVNGWDLGKALKLLLKGNAVIVEWLKSPIAYGVDAGFRDAFLNLAHEVADRRLIARHYLHLGEDQRRKLFGDGRIVAQKKIFYALRPAAALRWLRHHPQEAVAPMHFPTLLHHCDVPPSVVEIVAELMVRKAVTRELGSGPMPEPVLTFIDAEYEEARKVFPRLRHDIEPERRERVEAFFQATIRG